MESGYMLTGSRWLFVVVEAIGLGDDSAATTISLPPIAPIGLPTCRRVPVGASLMLKLATFDFSTPLTL